jgi:hypothetical protein
MTGGARGFCNPTAGGFRSSFGRGFGYGRGFCRGRGFKQGFGRAMGRGYGWAAMAYGPEYSPEPAEELNTLKSEAEYLKGSLEAINKRIDELEKKASEQS